MQIYEDPLNQMTIQHDYADDRQLFLASIKPYIDFYHILSFSILFVHDYKIHTSIQSMTK